MSDKDAGTVETAGGGALGAGAGGLWGLFHRTDLRRVRRCTIAPPPCQAEAEIAPPRTLSSRTLGLASTGGVEDTARS